VRYVRGSETSLAAAIDNLPRAGTQRRVVYDWIARYSEFPYDGITRDELEAVSGLTGNTIRPRVRELEEEGFIEETDRTRKTRSGSMATVLVATNVGVESEGCLRQPVAGESQTAVTLDSGVEHSASIPPRPGASDAPPANPYEYEVWAA